MYYKIENKESQVFKKLQNLRIKERQIEKDNEKAIEDKTGLKYENILGRLGQQNFRRVTQYTGFQFLEPEKVDLKIWQKDKEYPECFVPNNRTKLGREMAEFLRNGLKSSRYSDVWDILNLEHLKRFNFPFVEISGDVIILFLNDEHEPQDENIIEITKREFNQLLDS